jgi:hypothetical protein
MLKRAIAILLAGQCAAPALGRNATIDRAAAQRGAAQFDVELLAIR